ncbi:retrovirus-related pol polyprotein from transposon TNT 1-94 [Tanacetum coccineum]
MTFYFFVDDIIFRSTNPVFSNRFVKLMKDNFEMSMMGEMKFILGLRVHQSPRGIFISQSQYTLEILKKHGMEKCDPISTSMATSRIDADLQGTPTDQTKYHSMIGGLMYLTASRPHIKHALLKNTSKRSSGSFDAYDKPLTWVCGCHDDCKGTSGGIQFLGDKLVSWSSKKQACTSMSTAKADAIAISCDPVQHSRSKNINIRYHFIKKHVEKGTIELYFVKTEYQPADLFTKALPKERFEYLVHRIGVASSNNVRRPEFEDTNSKKIVLLNTKSKNTSTNVKKFSSSVSVVSNKRETLNSTVYSRVKRALFTSPVATKSRNLGATSIVAKSRFNVAKTPIATNKEIQLVLWIVDSGCSKHTTGNMSLLRNFVDKFIGTVRFGIDHFAAITRYGDYVQGNLTICHV